MSSQDSTFLPVNHPLAESKVFLVFGRFLFFLIPFSFSPVLVSISLTVYDYRSFLKCIFPTLTLLFCLLWGMRMILKKGQFPGSAIAFHQSALVCLVYGICRWKDLFYPNIELFYMYCIFSSAFYILAEQFIQFHRFRIMLPNILIDSLVGCSLSMIIFTVRCFNAFEPQFRSSLNWIFLSLFITCFGTLWLNHVEGKSRFSYFIHALAGLYCILLNLLLCFWHAYTRIHQSLVFYPLLFTLTLANMVPLIKLQAIKAKSEKKNK